MEIIKSAESPISWDCLFSRTYPHFRFALFNSPLPRRGRIQIVGLRCRPLKSNAGHLADHNPAPLPIVLNLSMTLSEIFAEVRRI
jgi:hypothetical protein